MEGYFSIQTALLLEVIILRFTFARWNEAFLYKLPNYLNYGNYCYSKSSNNSYITIYFLRLGLWQGTVIAVERKGQSNTNCSLCSQNGLQTRAGIRHQWENRTHPDCSVSEIKENNEKRSDLLALRLQRKTTIKRWSEKLAKSKIIIMIIMVYAPPGACPKKWLA